MDMIGAKTQMCQARVQVQWCPDFSSPFIKSLNIATVATFTTCYVDIVAMFNTQNRATLAVSFPA